MHLFFFCRATQPAHAGRPSNRGSGVRPWQPLDVLRGRQGKGEPMKNICGSNLRRTSSSHCIAYDQLVADQPDQTISCAQQRSFSSSSPPLKRPFTGSTVQTPLGYVPAHLCILPRTTASAPLANWASSRFMDHLCSRHPPQGRHKP